MFFTHTQNTRYRKGQGAIPNPWIDYGMGYQESIKKYFEKNVRVYDADTCGDITIDFLFEDGKSFRLNYSWWCNIQGEKDEYGDITWIQDEYTIEEIDPNTANVPNRKNRDWI
jgi:hypothetical protein